MYFLIPGTKKLTFGCLKKKRIIIVNLELIQEALMRDNNRLKLKQLDRQLKNNQNIVSNCQLYS